MASVKTRGSERNLGGGGRGDGEGGRGGGKSPFMSIRAEAPDSFLFIMFKL